MKQEVQLVFWTVDPGEYTIQICHPSCLTRDVSSAFSEWVYVGKGSNFKKQQAILLFKKEYKTKLEMERDLLNKQDQLNLKFSIKEVV